MDTCPSGDPQACVDFYSQKVSQTQGQAETLSGEIAKLDNQIALTQSRIYLTENKLGRVDGEIASISGRLGLLNETLNHTSEILLNRIVNNYKVAQNDGFLSLITSPNLNTLISRAVYLKIVQKHDQSLLEQMSLSKKNYSDQKDLLVDVKKKQEDLKKQLNGYKVQMDGQKRDKNQLLVVTNNNEIKYRELLSQAQQQLESFKGFITNLGGASLLSNQTSCDDWGCYYNQRDSQWGSMGIGRSSDSMAEYGCLVTSTAMVLSHYGHRVTPAQVARTNNAFFANTAYMLLSPWSIDGATFTRTSYGRNMAKLDEELAAGHPVIVGIGAGPDHFVVIRSKDGSDYKMYDPYVPNGKDISFKSKYSISSISVVNVVRVN